MPEHDVLSHEVKISTKIKISDLFKKLKTRHTFWGWLIRRVNIKQIRQVLWKIQSGHNFDFVYRRATDGRTAWNQSAPQASSSKCIVLNENIRISIKISPFVPEDPINNIPSLFQVMALRRPGDKPLSEPMMVSLLTHICATRPQQALNWKHWNK